MSIDNCCQVTTVVFLPFTSDLIVTNHFDPEMSMLADRHYSRRTVVYSYYNCSVTEEGKRAVTTGIASSAETDTLTGTLPSLSRGGLRCDFRRMAKG